MNELMQKASEKLEAARPRSGFLPETEAEWKKLQEAVKFLSYAQYRELGLPSKQAKEIAEYIFGGSGGRLLLELGYRLLAR